LLGNGVDLVVDDFLIDDVAHIGEIETKHGDENKHAAQQRVQEELDGGIFALRPPPDADEEVHRQQHDLPKDVEEEEIQGQERADHACFQEQKQHQIAAHVFFDLPTRQQGQERQKRGE